MKADGARPREAFFLRKLYPIVFAYMKRGMKKKIKCWAVDCFRTYLLDTSQSNYALVKRKNAPYPNMLTSSTREVKIRRDTGCKWQSLVLSGRQAIKERISEMI